jgi:hypothetical protein
MAAIDDGDRIGRQGLRQQPVRGRKSVVAAESQM